MQEQRPGPRRPSYRRWAARRGRQPDGSSDLKERASRQAAEILWGALTEAETVLAGAAQELLRARRLPPTPSPAADLQDAARLGAEDFRRAVDLLSEERRLLSEEVAALGKAVEQLEAQLADLTAVVADIRLPRPGGAPPRPPYRGVPAEEMEVRFVAGGEGVQLVIDAVPGFQDLMDLQRALSAMPAIEGASVEGYLEGEARLILHLRETVTADRIAEGLRQATGREVAIEEARPEALRLRLRLGSAS